MKKEHVLYIIIVLGIGIIADSYGSAAGGGEKKEAAQRKQYPPAERLPVEPAVDDVNNLLLQAVQNDSIDDVRAALNKGANPNVLQQRPDKRASLVICLQADRPNSEIVRLLLDKGADPNQGFQYVPESGKSRWTPLQILAMKPYTDEVGTLIKLLIEYGADPYLKNYQDVDAISMSEGAPQAKQMMEKARVVCREKGTECTIKPSVGDVKKRKGTTRPVSRTMVSRSSSRRSTSTRGKKSRVRQPSKKLAKKRLTKRQYRRAY